MSAIRLDMTMSLDGFVAGPDDRPGRRWDAVASGSSTGSTIATAPAPTARCTPRAWPPARSSPAGGRSSLPAAGTATTTTASRSSCSPTTSPRTTCHRDPRASTPTCGECAAAAREGAGGKDVMVHGAGAARALIRAGELDEIEVHVVPVLLGAGRRLFDGLEDLRAGRARGGASGAGPRRHPPALPRRSPFLTHSSVPDASPALGWQVARRPGPSGSPRRPMSGQVRSPRAPRPRARAGTRSRTHSHGRPRPRGGRDGPLRRRAGGSRGRGVVVVPAVHGRCRARRQPARRPPRRCSHHCPLQLLRGSRNGSTLCAPRANSGTITLQSTDDRPHAVQLPTPK